MATKVKRRAFTLVEVLTSIAVFSLAILVILATFNLTLRLNQFAKEESIAANVAGQTLDSYRAMSYDSIVVPMTTSPSPISDLPEGFFVVSTSTYQSNDKIKQIQVQVYWRNRPINRAIVMTTLKTPGGI